MFKMMGLDRIFYAPEAGGSTGGSSEPESKPEDGIKAAGGAPEGEQVNGANGPDAGSAAGRAWMAQLPGELKDNHTLAQYKTMGEAFKALMGEAGNAGKQQKQTYKEFGAKLNEEDDPFGLMGASLIGSLETLGIEQAEAEKVVKKFNEDIQISKTKMLNEGKNFTEAAVRKLWGNDYKNRRISMAKGYSALGDTDGSLQQMLDESGASLNPAVWEVLSRVGKLISEDGELAGGTAGGSSSRKDPLCPVDYSKPSA